MPSHEWVHKRGSAGDEMIVRIHSCLAVNALPETRGLLLNLNKPIEPRLTVRVEFDEGGLVGYQVYVEGWTSKGTHIVSQCIGYETIYPRYKSSGITRSLDALPSFMVPLTAMMRVRKKSLKGKAYWTGDMLWLHDVEVTLKDLTDLTRRKKWKYEINGEVIVDKLKHLLHDEATTKVLALMRLYTDPTHSASSKHPVATATI